jgi:hypothetical protein
MSQSDIGEIVRLYYEAWAMQDRAGARRLLHDELRFTSPQDTFGSAEEFLSACWRYSTGLAGVRFIRKICEGDQAFVIVRWINEDGSTFAGAEWLKVTDGTITEILVVNNDPSFGDLVE